MIRPIKSKLFINNKIITILELTDFVFVLKKQNKHIVRTPAIERI